MAAGVGAGFESEKPVTAWALFHSNRDAWRAVLEACADAKHSIAIEQYILAGRGIGAELLAVLTERAQAGVTVRVLADGYGSFGLTLSAAGKALLAAGGEIAMYNSLRALVFNPLTHMRRLHRKTVICDGRTVIVGGTCFRNDMRDWRDTVLRVNGMVGAAALEAFDLAWDGATRRRRSVWPWVVRQVVTGPGSDWAYLPSGPRPLIGRLYRAAVIGKIGQAKTSIELASPYLWPPPGLWRALKEALARGVRVRLLIPAKGNHFFANIAAHWMGRKLVRLGAEVYAYEPSMMHAKLALIDSSWASVGSLNLDWLSFALNLENGVATEDKAACAALGAQFEADFAQSRAL